MPTSDMGGATPAVEMSGITIEFPGVKALDNVDLVLRPGEIHALMGENGAGKSTLIKALTGVYEIDAGHIAVAGKVQQPFSGPNAAQAAGISTVYQEVNLCPNLSVAENVMLGFEDRWGPFINWRATRRRTRECLARLNVDIDPASSLGSHSIAIQQLCAIARAIVLDAKVLILDEPTSSLDRAEVAELFAVMRQLRDRGTAILFVSHFLEQIYEITDRLTVLRNGKLIGEHKTSEISRMDLISEMIGRSQDRLDSVAADKRRNSAARATQPALQAIKLGRHGTVEEFDLDLYEGQIVGFAGLLGSGRTEAARLLYGADRANAGVLRRDGRPIKGWNPLSALKGGVAFATEDRKKEGIIGDLTVRENIALAIQAGRGPWRRIPAKELDGLVEKYMKALRIYPADPNVLIKNLSGGNQQKVLLARWLATAPKVLILDEPTRGIDVGAKAEIQKLVADLAQDGLSVVFISSELEEVLRLSDRVVVMRDREKAGEFANSSDVTTTTVLEMIAAGN